VPTRQSQYSITSSRLPLALALLGALALVACGGGAERPSTGPASTSDSGAAAAQSPVATQPSARAQATGTATARTQATATPAQPAATRTPARTPTPLPPPEPAIGDTVQTDGWDITITSFDNYQRVGDSTASGIFLYLRMTIANTDDQPAAFPYDGLVVVDVGERTFFLAEAATRETLTYDFGVDFDQQLEPGGPRNVAAVFDIATDATGLILTTPSRVFQIRIEYDEPK
jgi:hypothetical protein